MAQKKDEAPVEAAAPETQTPPAEPPKEKKKAEAILSYSFDPNVVGPSQCKVTSTCEGQSFSSYGEDWAEAEERILKQIQNYLSTPEQKTVTVEQK